MGLEIHCVTGKGYRLAEPCDPLDPRRILAPLKRPPAALHVLEQVESTSAWLSALARERDVHGHVCLAESQPGGRGRRGRHWVATPFRNLILSMAWRFDAGPAVVMGLSLAAGLAVVEALTACGVGSVGLKWPNDILSGGRKLGGVLVEVQGEAAGPCLVILGVGINVDLRGLEEDAIDQPWTDLRSVAGAVQDRNRLAALLIDRLQHMFGRFEREGFGPFRSRWEAMHMFHGQPVRVLRGADEVHGTVSGVDENGALVLKDTAGGRQVFHSGEVSLRRAS